MGIRATDTLTLPNPTVLKGRGVVVDPLTFNKQERNEANTGWEYMATDSSGKPVIVTLYDDRGGVLVYVSHVTKRFSAIVDIPNAPGSAAVWVPGDGEFVSVEEAVKALDAKTSTTKAASADSTSRVAPAAEKKPGRTSELKHVARPAWIGGDENRKGTSGSGSSASSGAKEKWKQAEAKAEAEKSAAAELHAVTQRVMGGGAGKPPVAASSSASTVSRPEVVVGGNEAVVIGNSSDVTDKLSDWFSQPIPAEGVRVEFKSRHMGHKQKFVITGLEMSGEYGECLKSNTFPHAGQSYTYFFSRSGKIYREQQLGGKRVRLEFGANDLWYLEHGGVTYVSMFGGRSWNKYSSYGKGQEVDIEAELGAGVAASSTAGATATTITTDSTTTAAVAASAVASVPEESSYYFVPLNQTRAIKAEGLKKDGDFIDVDGVRYTLSLNSTQAFVCVYGATYTASRLVANAADVSETKDYWSFYQGNTQVDLTEPQMLGDIPKAKAPALKAREAVVAAATTSAVDKKQIEGDVQRLFNQLYYNQIRGGDIGVSIATLFDTYSDLESRRTLFQALFTRLTVTETKDGRARDRVKRPLNVEKTLVEALLGKSDAYAQHVHVILRHLFDGTQAPTAIKQGFNVAEQSDALVKVFYDMLRARRDERVYSRGVAEVCEGLRGCLSGQFEFNTVDMRSIAARFMVQQEIGDLNKDLGKIKDDLTAKKNRLVALERKAGSDYKRLNGLIEAVWQAHEAVDGLLTSTPPKEKQRVLSGALKAYQKLEKERGGLVSALNKDVESANRLMEEVRSLQTRFDQTIGDFQNHLVAQAVNLSGDTNSYSPQSAQKDVEEVVRKDRKVQERQEKLSSESYWYKDIQGEEQGGRDGRVGYAGVLSGLVAGWQSEAGAGLQRVTEVQAWESDLQTKQAALDSAKKTAKAAASTVEPSSPKHKSTKRGHTEAASASEPATAASVVGSSSKQRTMERGKAVAASEMVTITGANISDQYAGLREGQTVLVGGQKVTVGATVAADGSIGEYKEGTLIGERQSRVRFYADTVAGFLGEGRHYSVLSADGAYWGVVGIKNGVVYGSQDYGATWCYVKGRPGKETFDPVNDLATARARDVGVKYRQGGREVARVLRYQGDQGGVSVFTTATGSKYYQPDASQDVYYRHDGGADEQYYMLDMSGGGVGELKVSSQADYQAAGCPAVSGSSPGGSSRSSGSSGVVDLSNTFDYSALSEGTAVMFNGVRGTLGAFCDNGLDLESYYPILLSKGHISFYRVYEDGTLCRVLEDDKSLLDGYLCEWQPAHQTWKVWGKKDTEEEYIDYYSKDLKLWSLDPKGDTSLVDSRMVAYAFGTEELPVPGSPSSSSSSGSKAAMLPTLNLAELTADQIRAAKPGWNVVFGDFRGTLGVPEDGMDGVYPVMDDKGSKAPYTVFNSGEVYYSFGRMNGCWQVDPQVWKVSDQGVTVYSRDFETWYETAACTGKGKRAAAVFGRMDGSADEKKTGGSRVAPPPPPPPGTSARRPVPLRPLVFENAWDVAEKLKVGDRLPVDRVMYKVDSVDHGRDGRFVHAVAENGGKRSGIIFINKNNGDVWRQFDGRMQQWAKGADDELYWFVEQQSKKQDFGTRVRFASRDGKTDWRYCTVEEGSVTVTEHRVDNLDAALVASDGNVPPALWPSDYFPPLPDLNDLPLPPAGVLESLPPLMPSPPLGFEDDHLPPPPPLPKEDDDPVAVVEDIEMFGGYLTPLLHRRTKALTGFRLDSVNGAVIAATVEQKKLENGMVQWSYESEDHSWVYGVQNGDVITYYREGNRKYERSGDFDNWEELPGGADEFGALTEGREYVPPVVATEINTVALVGQYWQQVVGLEAPGELQIANDQLMLPLPGGDPVVVPVGDIVKYDGHDNVWYYHDNATVYPFKYADGNLTVYRFTEDDGLEKLAENAWASMKPREKLSEFGREFEAAMLGLLDPEVGREK